jgi:hypothetical protein
MTGSGRFTSIGWRRRSDKAGLLPVTAGPARLPLEERLVRIQAQEAFPALFEKLANEPIEVLATLADYAEDEILLLKAQAAVIRHPELARRILPLNGGGLGLP